MPKIKTVSEQCTELRSAPMYRALMKLVTKQEKIMGEGCGLTDALAYLRHIADELEQDFEDADRRGLEHYQAEVAEYGEPEEEDEDDAKD